MHTTTLRLALGMRGGVSLAVWIGGAVSELDQFRHAKGDHDDYYSKLLAVGRYEGVEVDVMSGASAGGLNAVLAAASMMGGKTTDGLQRIWLDTAGLRDLLESEIGPGNHRSLLNGSYFLDEIRTHVSSLLAAPDEDLRLAQRLELFLSATVLGGLPVPIVDDEFSSEEARRSGAVFHFRHLGNAKEVSDLLEGAETSMSLAARTTASFPTAFEPIEYRLSTNDETGGLDVAEQLRGRLQVEGTPRGELLRLLDGGVVDNIPVARALRGLPNVPAHNATDRWLIYMQPSPDSLSLAASPPGRGEDNPMPGFGRVLSGIVGGFMSESILDDVEVIRDHNLVAVAAWRAWTASVGNLPEPHGAVAAGAANLDDATLTAMRRVDAVRIMALLLDPAQELVWKPIGRSVPRSPLGSPGVTHAHKMREAIAEELESRDSVRPFAPMARTAAILTRWANLAELSEVQRIDRAQVAGVPPESVDSSPARLAEIGAKKSASYQLMHLAQLLTTISDWAAMFSAHGARSLQSDPKVVTREAQARAIVEAMGSSAASLTGSRSIADLVAALPLQASSLAFACDDQRFGPLLRSLYRLAPLIDDGGANVVEAMWARLAEIAVGLSAYDVSATGPGSDAVLAAMARKIAGSDRKQQVAEAFLRWIDQRTVGVHKGSATGLPGPVKYLRIGGSNLSPLCLPRSEFAFDGPRFNGPLMGVDASDVPAKLKLSGSDLANFSAFISQKWRANDWMWGRLDAAKSMVDVVCGGDRLPADPEYALAVIEAAVLAPMQLPDNVATVWGAPLQSWVSALWETYRPDICVEIQASATTDGSERLKTTKRVLVLRRQWEILAQELPVFHDADLKPIKRERARLADEIPPPTSSMTERLDEYENEKRSFASVWGSYWLTALAIRSGYALWAATRPRTRWKNWLRAPLKPLPVTFFAIILARNRGLLAFTVAFNVIVMPRLNGIGGLLGWAAAGGLAGLLGWAFRGRKANTRRSKPRLRDVPYEPGGPALVGLSLLAVAYGLAVQLSQSLRTRLHRQPRWSFLVEWSPLIDWYTLMAAAAGAIAAGLLWYCARWHFRVVSTLTIGFIVGFWTVFSRWTPPARTGVPWWRRAVSSLEFAFGSMTWALVAATTLTTAITHYAFRNRLPIARYGRRRQP